MFHPLADKTNNDHLPKPFSRSYENCSINVIGTDPGNKVYICHSGFYSTSDPKIYVYLINLS